MEKTLKKYSLLNFTLIELLIYYISLKLNILMYIFIMFKTNYMELT